MPRFRIAAAVALKRIDTAHAEQAAEQVSRATVNDKLRIALDDVMTDQVHEEQIAEAERRRASGQSGLAEAVARSLFKLMAIKDEFEVARLYSGDAFERQLAKTFQSWERLEFHLAPPLLARRDPLTGIPQKREFGGWVMPLFKLLAKFKGLRGSALDPFGYSAERRQERQLITEFEQDMDQILGQMTRDNYARGLQITRLPQKIRGFGHVKASSIEDYRETRAALLRSPADDDGVALYNP